VQQIIILCLELDLNVLLNVFSFVNSKEVEDTGTLNENLGEPFPEDF
jgi:hypothetical protein